jgi:hypothetical protein
MLLRLLQRALVISAVVGQAARGIEGEFFWFRKVFQTDGSRVQLEFRSHDINQALDRVSSLGSSGAAISVGGHFVGVNRSEVHAHSFELVTAG